MTAQQQRGFPIWVHTEGPLGIKVGISKASWSSEKPYHNHKIKKSYRGRIREKLQHAEKIHPEKEPEKKKQPLKNKMGPSGKKKRTW